MLAVLEIGNSNIVFALMDDEEVRASWRIETEREKSAHLYAPELRRYLSRSGVAPKQVSGVAVASVVPALESVLATAAAEVFGKTPAVLSWTSDLGIANRCDPPEAVGIDRLLNAAAAYERFGGAAITVDLGTATTIDVVNAAGEFLGGAIAPGLRTAADALSEAAPRLPRVDLALPRCAIGGNTTDALQSGIVLSYALMVDGMVSRMREELGQPASVIATGGLAPVVKDACRTIDHFDPNLTLAGIRLAYERMHPETA